MCEMRIRNIKELGAYVRTRRTQLGMGQATLAEKAGTSRKWLIEVEKGKPGAALGLVLRTLRALDVAVDLSADVPVSKPAKVLKPKAGKAAAIEPAKRHRRRVPILAPRRHDPAKLPAGDIDEVLQALKKPSLDGESPR
jgi:HTH-type transcriptional regulator / antitoxin HipB